MKNIIGSATITLFALLLLFVPTTSLLTAQNTTNTNPLSFKQNDRWCAIGSSITHQGKYTEMIYLYYLTRFPFQHFDMINCGAGGDTTTGTLTRRMDKDILPNAPSVTTILLGMNDIWWENSNLYPKEYYSQNLEGMVNKLENAGSRVILITPSPYDYSVESDEPIDPKRLGLERLAKEVSELAEKLNVPVIDFYNPLLKITLAQQALDPTFTLLINDRVHTKPISDFIMGYTFLKETVMPTLVSKIEIDANSKTIREQINCTAENIIFDTRKIQFQLLENALPYPLTAISQEALSFVNFNEEFNKELIQIDGLESGQYKLYIDDILIGYYSDSDFSKGINLAPIAQTPQNKQAEVLAKLMADYTAIVGSKLRYIAMIEFGELKKRYEIDDVSTPQSDIIKLFGKDNTNFDEYLAIKSQESFWKEKSEKLMEKIRLANKPEPHLYRIEKF